MCIRDSDFVDPFEGLDPATLSEEEIDEILSGFDQVPTLGAEQLLLLAEIQERELELAADVLECEPQFFIGGGQSEVFFEVLAEYEQAFLDENASEVAEFQGVGGQ